MNSTIQTKGNSKIDALKESVISYIFFKHVWFRRCTRMTINVTLKRFVIASVTKTKLCVNLVLVLNCLIFIHSVFLGIVVCLQNLI